MMKLTGNTHTFVHLHLTRDKKYNHYVCQCSRCIVSRYIKNRNDAKKINNYRRNGIKEEKVSLFTKPLSIDIPIFYDCMRCYDEDNVVTNEVENINTSPSKEFQSISKKRFLL